MTLTSPLKKLILLLLLTVPALVAQAQQRYFEPVNSSQLRMAVPMAQTVTNYSLFQLKEAELRSYLRKAPLEFRNNGASLRLEIPLPNGTTEPFAMLESPILSPAIAANHPEIKTYTGTGQTHRTYTIRLSTTANGFDAIILGVEGDAVYVTKTSLDVASRLYMVYFAKNAKRPELTKPSGATNKCGSTEPANRQDQSGQGGRLGATLSSTGATLRTFKLAVAATGEFTQRAAYGGNVNSAFAGLVGYVNRMNAVYRTELSIAFTLVSDVNLVFPDPNTDPYTNSDQGKMLDENQLKIDQVIGTANYDVGHVIGTAGGSGGGVAVSPSVCRAGSKAMGASGVGDGSFAAVFDDQLLSHEVGHQFSMSHTFNSSLPVCTTREPGTSVEPGAGTTIMSYGFTCDNASGNDNYESPAYQPFLNFHTTSYEQAVAYVNTLSCFTSTVLTNAVPVISGLPVSMTIPKSTPFALTATATDADAGDVLSYSWEGTNIGTVVPDGTTLANTAQPPFFRSYQPVSTGTRYFPRLSAILNGTNYAKGDKLPSVSIATTHRLTVRDNAGGLINGGVTVTIDGNSGPFLETTNLAGSYPGNSQKTITWDVANTTAAPVNCQEVSILLSTDGGLTFPTVLLANTPNDGTEAVTLPAVLTSTARIKIVSVNNIFFDISNVNFSIVAPAVPIVKLTSPDPVATEGTVNQSISGLLVERTRSANDVSDVTYDDPATLRFERSNSDGELVINYSLGGSATNGVDYVGLPGSFTFAAGESVRIIEVDPVDDDTSNEPDETVLVTLIDEASYDPDPTETTTKVTIKDKATTPFSITGVTAVSCATVSAGQRSISFTPQYAGVNGSPISFSVVNELAATTAAGPYTLRLYTDNPMITLYAVQSGVVSTFGYNWLAACGGGTPPVNQAPVVANPIPNQSATVGQGFSYAIPVNTFSDPNNDVLTLSVVGLPAGLSFTAPATISGTPSMSGTSTVTVTATDPGNLSTSTTFSLNVSPASSMTMTGPFSITGVTAVSCATVSAGQRSISFTPQYAGVNGSPISFSVVNELAATTAAGPYTLRLYTDNPMITLYATQSGVVSTFGYNWLAACGGGTPPVNQAPVVANPIPNQAATVGQGFSYAIPANTFSDPNNDVLTLSVSGLPAGLSFTAPATISGTPSMSGTSIITVTATDPGNLSASTSFSLNVSPATSMTMTGPFSITGVTTISCTQTGNGIGISFTPRYAGLTGDQISFSVVNELPATTASAPYTLSLYSDNPVITLRAVQAGTTSQYTYNWLAACNSNTRIASVEQPAKLIATLYPNPVGDEFTIRIDGAQGTTVQLLLADVNGRAVTRKSVDVTTDSHQEKLQLGHSQTGLYLLRINAGQQSITLKVIKK